MRLADVCEINPKVQLIDENMEVSFIAMSNVSEDGKISTNDIRQYYEVKKGFTCFQEKDVLFAKITPCMENGKGALAVGLKNGVGCGSTEFHVLRANTEILEERWLFYLTVWQGFRKDAERHMTGSAGQKRVPKSFLEQYELRFPTLSAQRQQIEVLDRIKNTIELRKIELNKLEQLIKARFVEMFGDPIINPRGLPVSDLGDLSELITKGASPSWQGFSYTDDDTQTLFVTSENVREGFIDISSPKYIEDGFSEKHRRSVLRKGDFLINIVGASIGRAAQFNLDCKANINQAAALVRINDTRIRDKYLSIYLNSEKAQQMYNSMKSDTGRANLSLQDINNLSILLPPVEEQKAFESFVSQVDKSKVAVQKSLDEAQMLFDSLMQQYFG